MPLKLAEIQPTCFHAGLLLNLFCELKMGAKYSSEKSVAFNSLHSVISQQIELFITTAVKISNPAKETLNKRQIGGHYLTRRFVNETV
jgi:hypothetical protein